MSILHIKILITEKKMIAKFAYDIFTHFAGDIAQNGTSTSLLLYTLSLCII